MTETMEVGAFVDEKSLHDRLLSLLSVIALMSMLALGIYWQSLPLANVATEVGEP